MSRSLAKQILDQALALPEEDRRRIGERLLDSVPGDDAEEIARAWDAELMRRIQAAERGETKARPWSEVAAEIRAKHSK